MPVQNGLQQSTGPNQRLSSSRHVPVTRIWIYLGILLGLIISSVFIYPHGIYPVTNLLIYLIITAGTLVMFAADLRLHPREQVWRNSIPGFVVPCVLLLAAWTAVRWMFMDVPFAGRPMVIGHLWMALGVVTGMYLAGLGLRMELPDDNTGEQNQPSDSGLAWRTTRRLLVVATLGFTLHALHQFFISHPETLHYLRQGLSGPVTDLHTQSLLHALEERRVGGRLGDSNMFSSQLAMMAVFCLASVGRGENCGWRVMGCLGYLLSCILILMSGSRGGLLTLIIATLFVALYFWLDPDRGSRQKNRTPHGGDGGPSREKRLPRQTVTESGHRKRNRSARIFLLFLLVATVPVIQSSAFNETWGQRIANISTIHERLFYWQIAIRVWLENPLLGSGPGSFELLYGTLKPELARESRFTHSWIFRSLAELGFPGLFLIVAFWGSVIRRTIGLFMSRLRMEAVWILSGGCLLCFSGLFQMTMENRDFLLVAGLLCGSGLTIITGHGRGQSMKYPGLMRCVYLFLVGMAVICTTRQQFAVHHKWKSVDLIQMNHLNEAENALEKAAAWLPDHPQYLVSRAQLKMRDPVVKDGQDNYSMAWPLLVQAADLNPYSASIRSVQSNWYDQGGRLREAIVAAGEAVQRYPSKVAYRLQRSKLNLRAGRVKDALEDIEYIENHDLPLWEYEIPRIRELRDSLE